MTPDKEPGDCDLDDLERRLEEAEQTLTAIRSGLVDALLISGSQGDQIYYLKGAEAPYRILVEQMQQGAMTLSADGAVLYCNERLAEMLQIRQERLRGSFFAALLAPESAENYAVALRRAVSGRAEAELLLRRADDSLVPTYFAAKQMAVDGEVWIAAVVTDLSEQKRHEELLAAERLTRLILDQSLEAIVVCDEQGTVVRANRAAQQLAGTNPLMRPFLNAYAVRLPGSAEARRESKTAPPAAMPLLERMLSGETLRGCEVYLDGGEKSQLMLLSAGPLYDEADRICGAVVTLTDITRQKQAEEALQLLNETLEEQVAERTSLAEQRAEQLRRMAAELTNAEQRERRRLAQVLHDHLQQLLVAARMRLAATAKRADDESLRRGMSSVDELIKQSIAEARTLTVELSPPILHDAGLRAAVDWLGRQMLEKHELEVTVEIDRAAEPEREEVRVLLFLGIKELLFNVVKHAGIRKAQVRVIATADEIEASVTDAGGGFQWTDGEANSEAGFGLLHLAERLEMLGGRMKVESTVGRGTTVRLLAPRYASETAVAPAVALPPVGRRYPSPPASTGSSIRVLLADDHEILRQGLVSILTEESDLEVVGQAADGQVAVELARQLQPDVVVMDITMPRLNGIEATRRLAGELPGIRIIGLTMHEHEQVADAMREAGATACLPKGGSSDVLLSAIRAARAPR